jgi:hypothetical protein
MKITTVLAAFAASSLIATGAFAQTMQPIPNPPETEHPHRVVHHHVVHHHVVHHVHHAANMGGEAKGGAAPNAAQGDQHPK